MSNMENKNKPYFIPILRLFDLIPNDVWEEQPHKKEYVEKSPGCNSKNKIRSLSRGKRPAAAVYWGKRGSGYARILVWWKRRTMPF